MRRCASLPDGDRQRRLVQGSSLDKRGRSVIAIHAHVHPFLRRVAPEGPAAPARLQLRRSGALCVPLGLHLRKKGPRQRLCLCLRLGFGIGFSRALDQLPVVCTTLCTDRVPGLSRAPPRLLIALPLDLLELLLLNNARLRLLCLRFALLPLRVQ
jgi:hypothetical protein